MLLAHVLSLTNDERELMRRCCWCGGGHQLIIKRLSGLPPRSLPLIGGTVPQALEAGRVTFASSSE